MIADTDQAAGAPLGFLNPALYKASTRTPSAFNDILPPANPNSAAVIRVDFANTVNASDGFLVSARAINYAGPETYCDATGNCATRNVTLTAVVVSTASPGSARSARPSSARCPGSDPLGSDPLLAGVPVHPRQQPLRAPRG